MLRALIEHTEDCDKYRGVGECTCGAQEALDELERLQRIERAAVDLFQACSRLTIDDMDKLEAELNAMSAALKP